MVIKHMEQCSPNSPSRHIIDSLDDTCEVGLLFAPSELLLDARNIADPAANSPAISSCKAISDPTKISTCASISSTSNEGGELAMQTKDRYKRTFKIGKRFTLGCGIPRGQRLC